MEKFWNCFSGVRQRATRATRCVGFDPVPAVWLFQETRVLPDFHVWELLFLD
jgi:hypothetical protein